MSLIFTENHLSQILLSGHNDSFNKYVKNICFQKLPIATLRRQVCVP